MKRQTLFVLLISVFLFVMPYKTFAGIIITVDDDSPADFDNIQAAIDYASSGDTVVVSDGLYTGSGNRNIDFRGRRITLRSENGHANCIIDCEYASLAFKFDSGETNSSTLDGFTITHGRSTKGGAIYCYRSKPKVVNCVFKSNRAFRSNNSGGYGGAIFARYSNGLVLRNCAFIANKSDAYGGGIFADVDSNLSVTNCTFAWNSAGYGAYATGGGMFTGQRTSSNLINCIFWGNSASYPGGRQLAAVVHSTIQVDFCDIDGGNSSTALYVFNDSSINWGIGNIITNPYLLSNSYRFIPGSPCINAGDPGFVSEPGETDICGRPRIIGFRVDIGAYEFNNIPLADAGEDQAVYAWFDGMGKVILDGSGSYDYEGHPLTYNWTFNIDSNSYDANGMNPIIELPVGEHLIELIVSDGADDSGPDWVSITVIPAIEVALKFTPQALNPDSQGKWVKAHFVMPEGFVIEDVNANTPATIVPSGIESEYINVFINEDGLVEIEAAFSRSDFCGLVISDETIELVAIGMLTSGQYFYGTDTIRIISKKLEQLAVISSYWLQEGCSQPDWCNEADLNQDSVVNFVDFALLDGCCVEVVEQ